VRLLITGGRGLLGTEIARVFEGSSEVRTTDREEWDVTDPAACRREVDGFRPDAVIHCAAYTAVDRAESEPGKARLLNVEGTRNVARACRGRGALVVTFGTDYIFDGTSSRPYREEDPANPLSVYGKTKWDAERALREEGVDHLLVRTQWMFGPAGRNFIRTILEKARRGDPLRVVSDQVGSPTSTLELAPALWDVLLAGAPGIYHAACEGQCSWYDLARATLESAGVEGVTVEPCTTAEFPRPAHRPAYSVLDCSRLTALRGRPLAGWREALMTYLGTEST